MSRVAAIRSEQLRRFEAATSSIPARYDHIDFKPPAGAAEEAKKALEWLRLGGRFGTSVGKARAVQLKNRQSISPRTVRRMFSFFSRHENSKSSDTWKQHNPPKYFAPSRGAWALWGGDAGFAWARKIVSQMDAADAKYRRESLDKFVSDCLKFSLASSDRERETLAKGLDETNPKPLHHILNGMEPIGALNGTKTWRQKHKVHTKNKIHYYQWDEFHTDQEGFAKTIEVYNQFGEHLGAVNIDGKFVEPPDPDKSIEVP